MVKLHGDYRDTRIRNTAPELETYEAEMDELLDRIFDEYGLIICGWSAAWDKALCRAVLRSPNRRFTTYWARRKQLNVEARALAAHRQAIELDIDSADSFFMSLETKLDAIERYSEPHPASMKLAVVSLKKFIADDKTRIELRDLVATETERTFQTLSSLPIFVPELTVEKILERMKLYENASEIVIALLAHGAFWGQPQHQRLWVGTLVRIAGISGVRQGGPAQSHLVSLQLYPACLVFYSSCLGAIAGNKYETFKCLCRDTFVTQDGQERSLIGIGLPPYVLDTGVARQLPGYERNWTPINNRIFEILREPLREYLPGDPQYEDTFDRTEYLTSLVHFDMELSGSMFAYSPVGRFGWRRRLQNKPIEQRILEEAEQHGESWAVLQAGLFPSLARFKEVENKYREQILTRARQQWY